MPSRGSPKNGKEDMRDLMRPPFLPPLWLLLAVLAMVTLHEVLPGPAVVPESVRVVGWGFIVGGIAMALYIDLIFKRRGTTILPFRTSSALVTGGPFRFSRNPIYCGMAAALFGLGRSLVALGERDEGLAALAEHRRRAPLVDALDFGRYFIRREEADLETAFGAEYRAYKARVRRWL